MIDYLRKPVRAVIRNLAILPSVDPNRLLPLGGTTGQFPMKASDEDGDIVWADFQVDDELSLDSEFPVQNKVLASEIYQLQSQLDGIPFPSSDDPLMDGEADPGESPDFARADHVHPHDTSKADVEDVPTKTSDLTNDSGYITEDDLPDAATATPLMDGTAAVGSSGKYAREDHVHPSDTSKITMPSGGSVGQVLKKTASGTEWANESGGAATVLSGTKSGSSVSVSSVDPVALYNTTAGTSVVLSIGKKRYNLHECGYRHSMDEKEYTFYFYGADSTDGLVQITLKGSVYDDDPSGTTTTLYGTYKYSSVTWTT